MIAKVEKKHEQKISFQICERQHIFVLSCICTFWDYLGSFVCVCVSNDGPSENKKLHAEKLCKESGIYMFQWKGKLNGRREQKEKKHPNNMSQIIWGHKACIQQYLQRVMNITAAVTLTFFITPTRCLSLSLLFLSLSHSLSPHPNIIT